MSKKPVVNSVGEKELQKVEQQFKEFDAEVQKLTLDRMNEAPVKEDEPQTKLSTQEKEKAGEVWLKPYRSIGVREKFNEDYRKEYEFAKEYVHFTAENNEIIGEDIDMWTKPFAGMPAEWWKVPVNKPIWAPRYLAEQLKRCRYHRLVMKEAVVTDQSTVGQFYGSMAVDTTLQRLDAKPASTQKSIFMGR